jgi:hypothetical protein
MWKSFDRVDSVSRSPGTKNSVMDAQQRYDLLPVLVEHAGILLAPNHCDLVLVAEKPEVSKVQRIRASQKRPGRIAGDSEVSNRGRRKLDPL